MNNPPAVRPARRLAITFESPVAAQALLDACARLAATLDAELEGIFVEDSNLHRLGELPFLRELRPASLVEAPLDVQRMRHELRGLARRAERMLEQSASALGIPWSFRIWQGDTSTMALTEGLADEALGLLRISRRAALRLSTAGKRGLPRTAHEVSRLAVLHDASIAAQHALQLGAQLAGRPGVTLLVLQTGTGPGAQPDLQHAIRELLPADQPLHPAIRTATDLPAVADALVQARIDLLVAGVTHPLLEGHGINSALQKLPCPVLLVR